MIKCSKKIMFLIIIISLTLTVTFAFAAKRPLVKVSTDKTEYVEGEELYITVVPEKDCQALILYVTASGETVRIILDGTKLDGKLKGGTVYRTPAAGGDRELSISAPFGKEKIVVYATLSKLPEISGEDLGNGLYLIPGGEKAIDKLLPNVSKFIWNLETFSKEQRGFNQSESESPIDMTGAAGRDVGRQTADEIK